MYTNVDKFQKPNIKEKRILEGFLQYDIINKMCKQVKCCLQMCACVEIFSQRKIMKPWNTNIYWNTEGNELRKDPKML